VPQSRGKGSLLSGRDKLSRPALPAIGLDSIVMSDVKGEKTVAQLYVGTERPDRPPWELRDFLGRWAIASGLQRIVVGSSSWDLRLSLDV
jgi:hypothetical protein